MSQIKNLIFDLGGVLLNIDFRKTYEAFEKIGCNDVDGIMKKAFSAGFYIDFEKGLIDADDFTQKMLEICNFCTDAAGFTACWNALLLDFPPKRIEILKKLGTKYRLFLLSNTNLIHYRQYNRQFAEQFNEPSLDSMFETAYFSHEMGLRKPDIAIYNAVIKQSNLIAEETLFVDDMEENHANAKKAGLETCLIVQNSNFYENEHFKKLISW